MGVNDAVQLLTTVASSKNEQLGGGSESASASYRRRDGVFILNEFGAISNSVAVHEATHAFEGNPFGIFYPRASHREGHAHAMGHLYDISINANTMLGDIPNEVFEEGDELQIWWNFWEAATGRTSYIGRINGVEFTFGAASYAWLKRNLEHS